jgi:hypothetical protein
VPGLPRFIKEELRPREARHSAQSPKTIREKNLCLAPMPVRHANILTHWCSQVYRSPQFHENISSRKHDPLNVQLSVIPVDVCKIHTQIDSQPWDACGLTHTHTHTPFRESSSLGQQYAPSLSTNNTGCPTTLWPSWRQNINEEETIFPCDMSQNN